jgi:L-serine dehydratase
MKASRADQIGPLDIFKIGIGPSSSHTVGPMLAALAFRREIERILEEGEVGNTFRLTVELFGSLAATGRGHKSDGAICAGLLGLNPRESAVAAIWASHGNLEAFPEIELVSRKISFNPRTDLIFAGWTFDGAALPHPNTLRFSFFSDDRLVRSAVMMSVGGGFIEIFAPALVGPSTADVAIEVVPYPYNTASEFIEHCQRSELPAWRIVVENEKARGISEEKLRAELAKILAAFEVSIEAGLNAEGILPGGLNVRRRAKSLHEKLKSGQAVAFHGGELRPSVYAIAVNEENAAGGRVVTAPTNGSSGLIPAVWRTLRESNDLSIDTLIEGLIVASVIGALVKVHASISGAEVGCQGEVGTSCAMAAAGATAMLGGTAKQIEQAAEIGIEHHLGLTCDPIQGLVQVPCIERNAMGAVKALNAMALSLASDGDHMISLDRVLKVMKETGLDMHQKYKETSTGGLALG